MTAIDVSPAAVVSPAAPCPSLSDNVPALQPPQAWLNPVPRSVPAHRWPAEWWIGRGDHALLVLAELAGLSGTQVPPPVAGELTVVDGVATIRTPDVTIMLLDVEHEMICGPCTLARWVHALDLTVIYQHGQVVAAVISRARR